ncbi:hypothetical protein EON66_10720 [archaeon]|nr:MAG: hypothetical protein EON66_10720 [archaeon]
MYARVVTLRTCLRARSRALCSLELLTHEDDYFAFILGLAPHCATVQHFCNTEVEAVHTDADQIQIIALAKAWGVRVRIAYLDATPGMTASEIVFPEDGSVDAAAGAPVEVTLLYRPGHYDVAYAK